MKKIEHQQNGKTEKKQHWSGARNIEQNEAKHDLGV